MKKDKYPHPTRGQEGYEEYRAAYNARRRARFEDAEYKKAERARQRKRAAIRKAKKC
ncbi:Uncharacterised protein [Mycobacteroides abscessus subsp. abscessus]|nr:Uncharacterised protein [Mycobacteroides abscessus subsp. abscessus]SHT81780.1 Uncharacterised protein [Mycobacteroides abscessus subsp. abscessus]SKW73617.1 Uncharacterised protein [Mycobacteroides abscessus subsp. abscessus]